MHACELIELAAVVAAHGPVLVRGNGQLSTTGIEQYWSVSKCRLDRWSRSLKRFSADVARDNPRLHRSRKSFVRAVLEEILTGEVLTRVWTAVICAYDRHRSSDHGEPLARSVLIGHLEARNRVLTLLVRGPGIDAAQAVKLNRLRRRTERWSDMLVGYLGELHDVGEFAVAPARAREFADDWHYEGWLKGGRHPWSIVLASLRTSFRQGLSPLSPNADLNMQIASSILSCFQPELFDSTGFFHSLWLMRLTNITNDAQGMLDELLMPENDLSTCPDIATLDRLADRLRGFRDV